jgi:hypothetical protein
MSTLASGDQIACKAFYGQVFGWKTDTFGAGALAIILFRLPGYVGGEPRQPVPRDVVALMVAAPNRESSRWGVDFWIDNVDAGAAAAARFGGSTIVPPRDVPRFRNAILQDPQGAIFSISQLVRTE